MVTSVCHGMVTSDCHGMVTSDCHGMVTSDCHGMVTSDCHGVSLSERNKMYTADSWCLGQAVRANQFASQVYAYYMYSIPSKATVVLAS